MAGLGMKGIKFFGAAPEILKAALDEAAKLGIGTTMHHAQMPVTSMNAQTQFVGESGSLRQLIQRQR